MCAPCARRARAVRAPEGQTGRNVVQTYTPMTRTVVPATAPPPLLETNTRQRPRQLKERSAQYDELKANMQHELKIRGELEERFLAYYGHIENVREGFLGMVRNHQRLQGELAHHLKWKDVTLADEDPVYNELHMCESLSNRRITRDTTRCRCQFDVSIAPGRSCANRSPPRRVRSSRRARRSR